MTVADAVDWVAPGELDPCDLNTHEGCALCVADMPGVSLDKPTDADPSHCAGDAGVTGDLSRFVRTVRVHRAMRVFVVSPVLAYVDVIQYTDGSVFLVLWRHPGTYRWLPRAERRRTSFDYGSAVVMTLSAHVSRGELNRSVVLV